MNPILKYKISDSAYLVNVSRTKSLHISKDFFAHLWIPLSKKAEILYLWDRYSKIVYPYDDIELGLRTEYFLTALKNHLENCPDTTFINLGSGFTSYQYLINNEIRTIEVDVGHIIAEKKRRAAKLIKEGILPKRRTIYLICDFNDTRQRISLYKKIKREIRNAKSTFILMEGLLYYLPKSTTRKLLYNNQIIQSVGSISAFDYWKPKIAKSRYYQGMIDFYDKEMGIEKKSLNLFVAERFVDLNCYNILDDTDVFKQERKNLIDLVLNRNKEKCLEESYITVERKACTSQHQAWQ